MESKHSSSETEISASMFCTELLVHKFSKTKVLTSETKPLIRKVTCSTSISF